VFALAHLLLPFLGSILNAVVTFATGQFSGSRSVSVPLSKKWTDIVSVLLSKKWTDIDVFQVVRNRTISQEF